LREVSLSTMSNPASKRVLTYVLAALAGIGDLIVGVWLELPSHGGYRGFGSLAGR
jgi:hypothetical protein